MTRVRRGKNPHKTGRRRRVARGLGRIGGPDLERRLRAAGLARDDETSPQEIQADAFRAALARRIAMTINQWPGCPEPACKRARGCMAPRILCSNAHEKPMSEHAGTRAMARMARMLKARAEELEAEAAAEPSALIAAPSPLVGEGIRSRTKTKTG
ncbi:MAG: hypothetical protein ACTHLO_05080 [Pseudolabrys sp.]